VRCRRSSRGFAIIDLLFVCGIISILSGHCTAPPHDGERLRGSGVGDGARFASSAAARWRLPSRARTVSTRPSLTKLAQAAPGLHRRLPQGRSRLRGSGSQEWLYVSGVRYAVRASRPSHVQFNRRRSDRGWPSRPAPIRSTVPTTRYFGENAGKRDLGRHRVALGGHAGSRRPSERSSDQVLSGVRRRLRVQQDRVEAIVQNPRKLIRLDEGINGDGRSSPRSADDERPCCPATSPIRPVDREITRPTSGMTSISASSAAGGGAFGGRYDTDPGSRATSADNRRFDGVSRSDDEDVGAGFAVIIRHSPSENDMAPSSPRRGLSFRHRRRPRALVVQLSA